MTERKEEVCKVGYINDGMYHACISVKNPTLTNDILGKDFSQLVLRIENLRVLQDKITEFLAEHDKSQNPFSAMSMAELVTQREDIQNKIDAIHNSYSKAASVEAKELESTLHSIKLHMQFKRV